MDKKELKYLVYATIFAFIVFAIVIPYVINSNQNISPYIQFLIFNVGIFVFLQIFLKSMAMQTKINLKESIGILLLFMALDLMAPPLLVSTSGVIISDVPLGGSSIDYIVGSSLNQFGITGFALYLMTYILAPFLMLLSSAILLKNFVKEV